MAAGLRYCDRALTVSPSYAVECCTDPEKGGFGEQISLGGCWKWSTAALPKTLCFMAAISLRIVFARFFESDVKLLFENDLRRILHQLTGASSHFSMVRG